MVIRIRSCQAHKTEKMTACNEERATEGQGERKEVRRVRPVRGKRTRRKKKGQQYVRRKDIVWHKDSGAEKQRDKRTGTWGKGENSKSKY